MFRPVIFAAPLVLALGLAACDGEDYEARVGELEGELQTVRTESEQMRTELEEARARVAELEQAQPQEGAAGADTEQIREPLETALAALARSNERLEAATGEGATMDEAAVTEVRDGLREATEAIGNAAQAVGLELQQAAPAR